MKLIISTTGLIAIIISLYLPWVSIFGVNVSAIDMVQDTGKNTTPFFLVICGVLCVIFSALRVKWVNVFNILISLIVLALAINYINDSQEKTGSISSGIIVLSISGLLLLIGGVFGLIKKKNTII